MRYRRCTYKVAFGTRDGDHRAWEQPKPAVHDRLEHRLRVRRRTSDHAEHLRGRGLPLERLLGLVEQAHVLDRDYRLVGEGLEQRDLVIGERRGLRRRNDDRADEVSLAQHRRPRQCRASRRPVQHPRAGTPGPRARRGLVTVARVRTARPATVPRSARPRAMIVARYSRSSGVVHAPRQLPMWSSSPSKVNDHALIAATEPLRARRDRVEDRLQVALRPADDLQDLGGRGLPLERFLGLVEQARVLDGDHRLVGEGLEERDLIVRERGLPRHGDRADRFRAPDHRYDQKRLVAGDTREFARRYGEIGIVLQVVDVDDAAFPDGNCSEMFAIERHREYLPRERPAFFRPVVLGDEVHQAAFHPHRCAVHGTAQSHRAFHDRIEDRLRVGR